MSKYEIKYALFMFALKTLFIQHAHAHILRLPCLTYGNFSIVKNESRLTSNVLETFNDLSEDECESKCIKHRLCKSINTKNSTGVNCELLSKSTEDPFDSVISTAIPGWTYKTTNDKAKTIGPYCEKENPCPTFSGLTCMDICSCNGYICQKTTTAAFKDCQEAYTKGNGFTGVYHIHVEWLLFFDTRCDMETNGGGWIVLQRHVDASVDFYRNWNEYKTGFGNLNGNFWLGLERIHKLAGPGKGAILRVDLKHMSNLHKLIYAEYSIFEISDEDSGYQLRIGGYSGDATDGLAYHNGMKFSTRDRDQDTNAGFDCAKASLSGWWHNTCLASNLNGLLPRTYSDNDRKYMTWYYINNRYGGIIFSEMKIRYKNA